MENSVNKKRLFIAVDIDESIRNDLKNGLYRKEDIGRVSWVRPENYHLTLKFLGNVSLNDIDTAAAIMDKAAQDKGEVKLTYTKVGLFPSLQRPRVIWVGFDEPTNTLTELAGELDEEISKKLGIKKEKRPFTPHLTVARIKGDVNHIKLSLLVKKGVFLTNESFGVSKIALYESVLKKSGAEYTKIRESSLK